MEHARFDCPKCKTIDSMTFPLNEVDENVVLTCKQCNSSFRFSRESLMKVKGASDMVNVPAPPPPPPPAAAAPPAPPAPPVPTIPPPENVPVPPQLSMSGVPGGPPPPPPVPTGVPQQPVVPMPTVPAPPPPMAAPPPMPVPQAPQLPPVPQAEPPQPLSEDKPPFDLGEDDNDVDDPVDEDNNDTPEGVDKVAQPPFSSEKSMLEDPGAAGAKLEVVNDDLDAIINAHAHGLKQELETFIISRGAEPTRVVGNPFKPDGKFKKEYKIYEKLKDGEFHSLQDIKSYCEETIQDTTFRNKVKKLDGLAGVKIVDENDFFKLEFVN